MSNVLAFSAQADALKHVLRAGRTIDPRGGPDGVSRAENAAEHSWHVALLALLLHPRLSAPVDLGHALALIAAHDLVEIEAGDTFAHDETGAAGQATREAAAAERLPAALRALWSEFEARSTPAARFAFACDRLQGFQQQIGCGAPAWAAAGVTESQLRRRMDPARAVDPLFDELIGELHERARDAGLFRP